MSKVSKSGERLAILKFHRSGGNDTYAALQTFDIFMKCPDLVFLIMLGTTNNIPDEMFRRLHLTSRHINEFPIHRRPIALAFDASMNIVRKSNSGVLYRLRQRRFNLSMTWKAVCRDHAFRCDDILWNIIVMRYLDDVLDVNDLTDIVCSYAVQFKCFRIS